jgi:hypothetical protein
MAGWDGEVEGNHMYNREYAVSLDSQDALHHMSREFCIPSKAELKAQGLPGTGLMPLPNKARKHVS